MAGFSIDRLLVDRALAGTGDIAVRAGFSSRHGPEPDRGLVAKASRPAFCQRDPADAGLVAVTATIVDLCDSAVGQTNPGTDAKCA